MAVDRSNLIGHVFRSKFFLLSPPSNLKGRHSLSAKDTGENAGARTSEAALLDCYRSGHAESPVGCTVIGISSRLSEYKAVSIPGGHRAGVPLPILNPVGAASCRMTRTFCDPLDSFAYRNGQGAGNKLKVTHRDCPGDIGRGRRRRRLERGEMVAH